MNTLESLTTVPTPESSKAPGNLDEIASFNRRGLFVGGCPKSGTTLLLSLLDDHPELAVLPCETHYLDQGRKYRSLRGFPAKLRHLLTQAELNLPGQFDHQAFARLAAEFVSQPGMNDSLLLSETARAYMVTAGQNWRECVRWVEKTPSNVPYADDLFRLFPAAKLIHIVRDPRAVFASRRRLHTNRYGTHSKAHRLVREWNESSRQISRWRQRADKYLLVHYEDLVQNSRAVMEEICRFIGIQFLPTLLEPTITGHQWFGNSAFHQGFKGIDAQPADHWKSDMTEDEIWWVEQHCRKGMLLAGYQPQSDAAFSFVRWARRLPLESWNGYLRARRGSLSQMAGLLKECRYDLAPVTSSSSSIPKSEMTPPGMQIST